MLILQLLIRFTSNSFTFPNSQLVILPNSFSLQNSFYFLKIIQIQNSRTILRRFTPTSTRQNTLIINKLTLFLFIQILHQKNRLKNHFRRFTNQILGNMRTLSQNIQNSQFLFYSNSFLIYFAVTEF